MTEQEKCMSLITRTIEVRYVDGETETYYPDHRPIIMIDGGNTAYFWKERGTGVVHSLGVVNAGIASVLIKSRPEDLNQSVLANIEKAAQEETKARRDAGVGCSEQSTPAAESELLRAAKEAVRLFDDFLDPDDREQPMEIFEACSGLERAIAKAEGGES